MIKLIDHNRKILTSFVDSNIPQIKMIEMEGTYLQWMDFNALGIDHLELERIMQQEAFLFFDEGYIFGEQGKGFERINLACPTFVLEKAQERLLKTLNGRHR